MVTKEQMLGVIGYGHDEILRFVEHLSEAERNTTGEGDEWTVRDMLSHVIETMRISARRMTVDVQGGEQEDYGDNDQRNASMVAAYRRLSWEEVFAALQAARSELEALVDLMTEEELNDPQRYARFNGAPIWRNVVGNAVTHPLGFHIRPWYSAHGDADYATQQAEKESRLLQGLSDEPVWQGNVLYNLACQYALGGHKDAALQRLERAVQLAPNFVEYAKQDSDFASLRGLSEFDALLTGEASPR